MVRVWISLLGGSPGENGVPLLRGKLPPISVVKMPCELDLNRPLGDTQLINLKTVSWGLLGPRAT